MEHPPYWKEIAHSQHRRAIWHNYYDRAIYMVTLCKHKSCPSFGTLRYSHTADAYIALSPLGEIIKYQIEITPKFNPELIILSKMIMPDHVHILVHVTTPINKHFGDIIQAMKAATTAAVRKLFNTRELTVFEEGFHDRIVKSRQQLDTLYRYLRDNPRRLAVRRANPDFFRRVNTLRIGDKTYQAYGNMQLLESPFREQVVVHRAGSGAKRNADRALWLYTAANGGVLVSPFISPAEKAIRTEAESLGGRFILIVNTPMADRYKPAATDFALCEAGRLLIVSADLPADLSRSACLAMNALAATLSTAGK